MTEAADDQAGQGSCDIPRINASRSWEVVSEIELECNSAYREGMDAPLAHLVPESKRDGWTILLIHSLNRLPRRGVVQTVNAVTQLADTGIRLTSYREADMTESSNPYGEPVLSVFAFLAKLESSIKGERAKRSIAAATARGVRVVWPPGAKDRKK